MNDLKSDPFPSHRLPAGRRGAEGGGAWTAWVGGSTLWGGGGRLLSSLARIPGERRSSGLLITHQTWMVYFIHERQ